MSQLTKVSDIVFKTLLSSDLNFGRKWQFVYSGSAQSAKRRFQLSRFLSLNRPPFARQSKSLFLNSWKQREREREIEKVVLSIPLLVQVRQDIYLISYEILTIESPFRLRCLIKLKMDTCWLFDVKNDTTIIIKSFANSSLGPSQAGHLPNFIWNTYDWVSLSLEKLNKT